MLRPWAPPADDLLPGARVARRAVREERSMAGRDLVSLARENIEAFSAGDWDRWRATVPPDAVYEEPATGRRVQGRDQLQELARGWKRAFPDVRGTVTTAVAAGDTVTLEITWEGTHTGPLEGPGGPIPASGKRTVTKAAQVITCEGGALKETRHYFDLLGLLQQIGALPAPGQPR
jgi:steroid delta-isomerase-like uncharacterized protein